MNISARLKINTFLALLTIIISACVLLWFDRLENKVLGNITLMEGMIRTVFDLDLLSDEYVINHGERTKQQWQIKYDYLKNLITKTEYGKNTGRGNVSKRLNQNVAKTGTIFMFG